MQIPQTPQAFSQDAQIVIVFALFATLLFIIALLLFTRLKLKQMADQSTVIEGLVTRINTDVTNLKTMLSNVISNTENTLSDQSLADLNAAVSALDGIATATATAPNSAE